MNDRPSAPQGNQCLLLHFLASLGVQEKTNCTSMLLSIDSCQNRVSADQYHLTVLGAQVSTHRGRVFFWSYPLTNYQFQMIAGSRLFFPMIHMKYVVSAAHLMGSWLCLCHYGPALLRFWFQTDLERKNSASFLKIQAGKTFCYHGHALVTICVQFLFSDWSKFDRWVHAENLCSILKVVYFDSLRWSWQSFVSTCDVFNCLFPLDVQNEIQLLSRVSCYSWLVYLFTASLLIVFWLRDASLVKVGNPISDGIVFVFHLACRAWPTHDHNEKSQKQPSSLPVKTGWIFASEVSLKSRF